MTRSYDTAALKPAPYTDRYVSVGGLKLHVQDYGTAGKPQMLCVHGSAAHAHWFDFVASGLNDEYHVLAPDQRGHGDSEWDLSAHPEYNYDRYAADLKSPAATITSHSTTRGALSRRANSGSPVLTSCRASSDTTHP